MVVWTICQQIGAARAYIKGGMDVLDGGGVLREDPEGTRADARGADLGEGVNEPLQDGGPQFWVCLHDLPHEEHLAPQHSRSGSRFHSHHPHMTLNKMYSLEKSLSRPAGCISASNKAPKACDTRTEYAFCVRNALGFGM